MSLIKNKLNKVNRGIKMKKKKSNKKTWLFWIIMVIMPYIGIPLMWLTKKNYSNKQKGVLSIVFSVWFVFLAISVETEEINASPIIPTGYEEVIYIEKQSDIESDEKDDLMSNNDNSNIIDTLVADEDIGQTSELGFSIKENVLIYNNIDYTIIEVDGGDRNGTRKRNVAVDIGYGDREYWALSNEYGQLVYVFAEEIIVQDEETESVNSSGRYYTDEADVLGVERDDLDKVMLLRIHLEV